MNDPDGDDAEEEKESYANRLRHIIHNKLRFEFSKSWIFDVNLWIEKFLDDGVIGLFKFIGFCDDADFPVVNNSDTIGNTMSKAAVVGNDDESALVLPDQSVERLRGARIQIIRRLVEQ